MLILELQILPRFLPVSISGNTLRVTQANTLGIIFMSYFFLILFLIHISEPLQHLLTPPSKYTQNMLSVCSLVLPPLGPHRFLSGLGWDCSSHWSASALASFSLPSTQQPGWSC